MENLTPWYPPKIKPVRVGPYRVKYAWSTPSTFQFWNGKWWGRLSDTADEAEGVNSKIKSTQQRPTWRGLAEKP